MKMRLFPTLAIATALFAAGQLSAQTNTITRYDNAGNLGASQISDDLTTLSVNPGGNSLAATATGKLRVFGNFWFENPNSGNGTGYFNLYRPATTHENFLAFRTGSNVKWLAGMDNDATENFRLMNGALQGITLSGQYGWMGVGMPTPAALIHARSVTANGTPISLRLERFTQNNQDNYLDVLITGTPAAGINLGAGSISFRSNNGYQVSDIAFMQNPTSLGFVLKSNGNFCVAGTSPTQKFQVDAGNSLVRGTTNFGTAGDKAYLYMGDANHFISAENNKGVSIGTYGYASGLLHVLQSGKVLIGDINTNVNTQNPYKLYVETGILTEKVKVALVNTSDWADYVFKKDYKLSSLEEVKTFIEANQHLPGVPSAEELVKEGGFDLGKMDAKLLEKIEELTLYMIQLKEENQQLKERISKLEAGK